MVRHSIATYYYLDEAWFILTRGFHMIHPDPRPNTWILSGDPAVSALLTTSGLYLEHYGTLFLLNVFFFFFNALLILLLERSQDVRLLTMQMQWSSRRN